MAERKQQRWEKGQSIHHKDDKGCFQIENAYGRLQYIKEDTTRKKAKNGFILEAKEAPGTPGHTEKEKHIELDALKKAKLKGERFLYSCELPFHNQAIFYDITEWERSREFIECMKRMLSEGGHKTLKDTFGFMEQEPERFEKKIFEQERMKKLTLEEFDFVNKQIDILNDRIQKKEAKERQLRAGLQLMIDRGKEEQTEFEGSLETVRQFLQEDAIKAREGDSEDEDLNEKDKKTMANKKIENRSEN